jgi:uncharacterized protein
MTDTSPRSPLGLIAIAAAIFGGALALGSAARSIGRKDDVLAVTGSARRAITADLGIWEGSVVVQASSVSDAYAEVTRYTERVKTWLAARKLPAGAMTVQPVATQRMMVVNENGQETGQLAGYKLTQSIEVRLPDAKAIQQLAQDVGTLAGEGIPLSAEKPRYLYTKLAELRVAMMGDATTDARARADAIAKAAGSEVGTVRNAQTGVVQITPRFSTEVSDYGMNDESSIEKDITTVVKVTFALK